MGMTDAASGPVTDNAGKDKDYGLNDAITAAMEASEARSTPEKEVAEKKVEPTPKAKPAKVEAKAKAEPAKESTAGDDSAAEDTSEAEASKPESEAETPALAAPKHWPDADKQAFGKMTREGQEIALRLAKNLEGGFTRKSQELSDKAKFADSVRGLFDEPTRGQLRASGVDEIGYVRHLHSIQQFATAKPVEYIKFAMQNLRVTPEMLGISQAAPQQQPGTPHNQDAELQALLADPKVAAMEAQLKQLQARIEQEDQARQQAKQAELVNAHNAMNSTIRAFREALDDNGQLQYPHFDAVQREMGALMDTNPELAKLPDGPEKLQAAYDMAIWARPDLRQSFIEAEAAKKAIEAQKKADALRAKKVTSVKPAAGVVSTKSKPDSLMDAINQAASKHGL